MARQRPITASFMTSPVDLSRCTCEVQHNAEGNRYWLDRDFSCPVHEHVHYLGTRVKLLEVQDGWVLCEWPDGKTWKHWPSQLRCAPCGTAAFQ
jgi:hypothetical protein